MRIAVSLLSYRPGRIGGAETYLQGLVPALIRGRGTDEIVLIVHRDNAGCIPALGAIEVRIERAEREITLARCLEAFTPYRARFAERALESVAPDVAFFPQQSIFPKRLIGACVLTVHDVQHLLLPRNISWAERVFRRAIYPWSLRRADGLIAVSEFTKRTLFSHCGVDRDRATAVPHGYEPAGFDLQTAPAIDLLGPYVYYPAATWPHKNHEVLLRSIAALRAKGRFNLRLVLSGKQTSHWPRLRRRIQGLGLSDIVVHEGYVTRQRVAQLYRGAEAVLLPTQFEGFGLPILEAAAFGKRVITSRLAVFDEVGVPAENQIDFTQPDQLLQALGLPAPTVLTRSPWTWDDCARATLDVLRTTGRISSRRPETP